MYEVHFAGFDHYNRASFEMVTLQQGFWKLMRPWTGKLLLAFEGRESPRYKMGHSTQTGGCP